MHFGCLLYSLRMYLSAIAILTLFLDVMLSRGCSKISWLRNAQGISLYVCDIHSRNHLAMIANNIVLITGVGLLLILKQWGLMFHLLQQNGSCASFQRACLQRLDTSPFSTYVYAVPVWFAQTYLKFFSHFLSLLWADNPSGVGCFIQRRSKGFVPCCSGNFQGRMPPILDLFWVFKSPNYIS